MVFINPKYFRPAEVEALLGSPEKALSQLGWEPKIDLEGLIKEMISHDLDLAKKEKYYKSGINK